MKSIRCIIPLQRMCIYTTDGVVVHTLLYMYAVCMYTYYHTRRGSSTCTVLVVVYRVYALLSVHMMEGEESGTHVDPWIHLFISSSYHLIMRSNHITTPTISSSSTPPLKRRRDVVQVLLLHMQRRGACM